MNVIKMWVYFSGEVHGINTGWRVTDVEVGRKWVYLKTTGKRRHRVSRKIWDLMGKRDLRKPDAQVEAKTQTS